MVMLLHSSSLMAGGSPYARSPQALEELYVRLDRILDYCVRQRGFESATLSDCAASVAGAAVKEITGSRI
jgi:hypothetical protein